MRHSYHDGEIEPKSSGTYFLDENAKDELKDAKSHLSQELKFDSEDNVDSNDSIAIQLNRDVAKWISYFTVKKENRARFQRFLNRGAMYKESVLEILKDNGMPEELYYLPIIESGYQTHARSHASAVGTWQFIRGTGKNYGLRIDSYVDERRDPIRSTEAATKYLRDLYRVFNDWYLAMASYNAGESRVMGAIMRGNTRSFWELSKKKVLPRETRNYVPKFLAAVIIGENPDRYGFHVGANDTFPDIEAVEVPGSLSLNHIAGAMNYPLKKLKELNPHLLRSHTPPSKGYDLWVPDGFASTLQSKKKYLAAKVNRSLRVARTSKGSGHYRVRRGDNLSSISKKYNVTISALKRANSLRSSRIRIGQRLRIPGRAIASLQSDRRYHKVKRGENLSLIAKKHGLSIHYLKKINRLKNAKIYPGQKLITAARKVKANSNYRVRRGDNLTLIAKKVGVSMAHLKKVNRIRGSKIFVGQLLKY